MKLLNSEKQRFDRKVWEAFEIQYHKCGPDNGGMNIDNGQYVKTLFWTPFLNHLRKSRRTITSNIATSNDANITPDGANVTPNEEHATFN